MKSVKFLDEVMKKQGLRNDKALCEFMGWSHSVASHYRTGKRVMDNETCLKIAQVLEMEDPLPIIMAADMDRAEKAGQHSLWEVFSARMAKAAAPATLAIVAAGVTSFLTPSPVQAATRAILQAGHFILCQIRRLQRQAINAI